MSTDRARQIEELFHNAVQRKPSDRAAYLNKACAGDPGLLAELIPLVAAFQDSTDFLERPLPETLDKAFTEEQKSGLIRAEEEALVGHRMGPWKLVRRIASGGMGTVYLASRDDGQYQRQAAIKLIRPGIRFDEPQYRRKVIRHFHEEQQLLADLEHPNIAKLLDGGTTEDGLPYLVMDYIEGKPITEYCEQNKLSVHSRLTIVRDVCLALQYAHGKLIAHRDLKPSNILVSPAPHLGGAPVPRLLDFGIAKILKEETGGPTGASTAIGLGPMTLDYASPEQIRGETLTTLSDVYSLGVVIYEVLTGELPYEMTRYSAERVISGQMPKRPSAVRKGISREVDAIVMKALAKDPERRYQSAAALAEDIDRYLAGLPISAHPPSLLYQAGKFVFRYKWTLFLLACGIATGLEAGLAWQSDDLKMAEQEQRNIASRLYVLARAEFLFQERSAEQAKKAGLKDYKPDYTIAEGLLHRINEIEKKLPPEPAFPRAWTLADRKELLGKCLFNQAIDEKGNVNIDKYRKAEPLLVESYNEFRKLYSDPDKDKRINDARDRLIQLYEALGEPDKAMAYRRSTTTQRSVSKPAAA
jgi:tRNA A-37 threonylcarbamoyl transferase component Bud32